MRYNRLLGLKNASKAWSGLSRTIRTLLLSKVTPDEIDDEVEIDAEFFNHLDQTSITELNICKNNIVRIQPLFSIMLPHLTTLTMSDNRISNVQELIDDIANLTNLRQLDVSRQLWPLQIYRLKRNNFQLIRERIKKRKQVVFRSIDNETYHMYQNYENGYQNNRYKIKNCHPQSWKPCPMQTDVRAEAPTLRGNPLCINITKSLSRIFLDESISVVGHTLQQTVIHGGKLLRQLSLKSNGLQRLEGPVYFTEPPTNLRIDLQDNQIRCLSPELFQLTMSKGGSIVILNLSGNRLADQLQQDADGATFYYYLSLEDLNLANNGIKELHPRIFNNLRMLKRLNLNHNSLRTLDFSFSHMHRLSKLDLSFNLISNMNDSLLETISKMFRANGSKLKLNLSGNPLQCSCQTLNFLNWMDSNKERLDDFEKYLCMYPKEYVPFTKLSNYIIASLIFECSMRTTVIVSGSLLGLGLLLLATSVCCYRHRWEVRYTFLRLTQRGQRYQQIINQPVEFEYDAFVVYDSEDRQWVNSQLVPRLEQQYSRATNNSDEEMEPVMTGRERIRLCVHERDFRPGQQILNNIWSRMEQSRKVILVISNYFTQSNYCDYEMNLARMQSVEQGRNLLVPILLEQPDVDRVSDCLYWVLRRLTYLEWPRNVDEQEEFWQKLREALSGSEGDMFFNR